MAVSTAEAEARRGTICAPRTLSASEVRYLQRARSVKFQANSRRQLVCRHARIAQPHHLSQNLFQFFNIRFFCGPACRKPYHGVIFVVLFPKTEIDRFL